MSIKTSSEIDTTSLEEDYHSTNTIRDPPQVELDRCQNLQESLNPLIPLAPECVLLNNQVQDMSYPLDAIQDSIPRVMATDRHNSNSTEAQERPRRSCRIPFCYREFNNTGLRLQFHADSADGMTQQTERLYLRRPRGKR